MFVRYISHEIRTPLNTAVLGMQVLTSEVELSSRISSVIKDVGISIDIAVNTLNELLLFDKLETGNLLVEKTVVNAATLVSNVVETFQIQVSHTSIFYIYMLIHISVDILFLVVRI